MYVCLYECMYVSLLLNFSEIVKEHNIDIIALQGMSRANKQTQKHKHKNINRKTEKQQKHKYKNKNTNIKTKTKT